MEKIEGNSRKKCRRNEWNLPCNVENFGNPGKILKIPAGSQVDKPKHSKAHKIDFCGLFCF